MTRVPTAIAALSMAARKAGALISPCRLSAFTHRERFDRCQSERTARVKWSGSALTRRARRLISRRDRMSRAPMAEQVDASDSKCNCL